jgi:hypothetical protein
MGVTHRRRWAPRGVATARRPPAPGLLFNGAALALFVLALWRGSERGGELGSIALIAAAWFVLLLGWLFWAVVVAWRGGVTSALQVLRWVLAPWLFVLAAALVFGGYALDARFQMSVGALDAAADAALAGDPVAPGWIGLYRVDDVSLGRRRMVRFTVRGQHPLVRGTPRSTDSVVSYRPIAGDWWFEVNISDWFRGYLRTDPAAAR